jgi:hypothetical protein
MLRIDVIQIKQVPHFMGGRELSEYIAVGNALRHHVDGIAAKDDCIRRTWLAVSPPMKVALALDKIYKIDLGMTVFIEIYFFQHQRSHIPFAV